MYVLPALVSLSVTDSTTIYVLSHIIMLSIIIMLSFNVIIVW